MTKLYTMRRSLLLAAIMSLAAVVPVAPATDLLPLQTSPIRQFQPGSAESRFGSLEFVGGFQFSSSDSRLGGVSAIRFRPNGRDFVAVQDTGEWLTGSIERDAGGRLSRFSSLSISAMQDTRGRKPSKSDIDAEGLALQPGRLIVSYERRHRIDAYPDPGYAKARPQSVEMVIPRGELRANGGIETLVSSPKDGPLEGALVAVAERSIDGDGNLFAAVLSGARKGVFKVARQDPWAVTDGAFLPDGDLLLLERRFSYLKGVGMRLRRIETSSIKPGALVDGEVLIEADMGAEIDNMEGVDVLIENGETRIILVSDDNRSFLQRNVMLEFRLVD
nr:esterase-like activity of phytase family protein [Pseudorhizobium flavum]